MLLIRGLNTLIASCMDSTSIIPRIMTFDLPKEGVGTDVQLLGVEREVFVCQQQWIYSFYTKSLCSDIGGNIT